MDNTTTITLNPNTPMKEIPMSELKNNTDIPESFKTFLATGSSVIETCRELLADNERLRKINDDVQRVFNDHGIHSADNLRLYLEDYASVQKVMEKYGIDDDADLADALDLVADGKKSDTPADYQTLKDFKGEMDAIHEEFDIPHDVNALRKDLQMAKSIKEAIDEFTDIDIGNEHAVANIREALEEYHDMKEACDNHGIEYADLDSTLEEKDQYDNVLGDHDITDASDLDDTLTDMEDAKAYEKGFNELAEFVEKIKEVIGHCGDDIPATNMEDYK